MGGWAPLGYDVQERKLVINEAEAKVLLGIFERFSKGDTVTTIVKDLNASGFRNKYGQALDKGRIYKLLRNRVYVGEAVHKGIAYPGEHEAIVPKDLWDKVQAILDEAPRTRAGRSRAQTPALLKGLIFGPTGAAMSPTHTRKNQRLYRYYVSQRVLKEGREACPVGRVPAAEVEAAVIEHLRVLLQSPEVVVSTWRSAREHDAKITETEVRTALQQFDGLWDELFPAEQARIIQLLVERVDVDTDGLRIRLRTEGLGHLFRDIGGQPEARAA
jgi:hypothetical protein